MVSGLDLNEAEDGLIVFDEGTDTVHHLNGTAAVILGLCDGSRDCGAIATELGNAFGLDAAPIDETLRCLADLSGRGLIDWVPRARAGA